MWGRPAQNKHIEIDVLPITADCRKGLSLRYIDAFCHFSPKRYFDAMLESPAGHKDIGKRVRGIPALYDLDVRRKVVDQFVDYAQVLSLGLPMIDRLWGPDKTPQMAKLAN